MTHDAILHRHQIAQTPDMSDDGSLAAIRALIHVASGISLGPDRNGMVRSRLAKRLTATRCGDLARYVDLLDGPHGDEERMHLIAATTTNVTRFFREPHHFDLACRYATLAKPHPFPLRIWSAGCSTGEEPYSMAMALIAAGLEYPQARILATDINPAVIETARQALYPRQQLAEIPARLARRFTVPAGKCSARIAEDIRSMVTFRQENLIGDWHYQAPFDAILCRNVAIYFDPDSRCCLWWRLISRLRPGGLLFIGHAERLTADLLELVEQCALTSYVRKATAEDRPL